MSQTIYMVCKVDYDYHENLKAFTIYADAERYLDECLEEDPTDILRIEDITLD